ncbi:MAG: 2-oxoglutarate dehydrogenase E1 component [Bacteroidota bacterium]
MKVNSKDMNEKSFLSQADIATIENMYQAYRDGESVEDSWRHFFEGFELAQKNYAAKASGEIVDKEFKVVNLINGYRKRGHLFTKTNPVRSRRKYFPTLDIENYGLNDADLDKEYDAGKFIGLGRSTLRDIIAALERTYCSSIGAEYMFIRQPEVTKWLKDKMESVQNQPDFSDEEKKHIFYHLNKAVGFEQFIHKKFTGQKRFSLEGGESLIPALDALIEKASKLGAREFVFGMSHRGRLNVLSNIMQKGEQHIFEEFTGKKYLSDHLLGDVKYHLGYSSECETDDGIQVRMNLLPNPSHLELVGPVVEGVSRAKTDHEYNGDYDKVVPVIIHGDAAIAAQGSVYETIQMSQLEGYKTGGTIHMVINNQLGFTTNYLDGRSSTYCTDVAKVIKAPIFHVNADDPEAIIYTTLLAMEFRQQFHTDVFIDILGYRKYGHNEGDEPRFTQPVLYDSISEHTNARDLYAEQLQKEKILSKEDIRNITDDYEKSLENSLKQAKSRDTVEMAEIMPDTWESHKVKSPQKLSKSRLKKLNTVLSSLPEDKPFLTKVQKMTTARANMFEDDSIDWGLAEQLAYASILEEGLPVRLSGQDTVRGTFSHRHASFFIQKSRESYTPLKHIAKNQGVFSVYNSPLSELAVLGFEYGYAMASPGGLTIWEAQFGDFGNMAQAIFDQYISSAEAKWRLRNGLVMFLPHGYEGQGPEHSSARIERYTGLAADGNMQIIMPTTPDNMFHALRNHVFKDYKHPMIVFTPKSLLRHPEVRSTVKELTDGQFRPLIDDPDADPAKVKQFVLTYGKLYYQIKEKQKEYKAEHIAIVRLEQFYPFPEKQIQAMFEKYSNVVAWVFAQDEPANMGVYRSICQYLKANEFELISRPESSSPAPGLPEQHREQEKKILDKVFRKCDCEWNRKQCDMHCVNFNKNQ